MHTTFPNGSGTGYWDACQSEGCLGEAVDRNARCLLHATPDMREQYLSSLTNGELQRLSLRGVSVSQELLEVVLRSHIFRDKRVMIPLDLTGADMDARATLADYKFDQYVTLNGSIIREQKGFRFERCEFRRGLTGSYCLCDGGVPAFINSKFLEDVNISYMAVERTSLGFTDCEFSKSLIADGLHFEKAGFHIRNCTVRANMYVRNALIAVIQMEGGEIGEEIDITGTRCEAFRAQHITAQMAHQLGPIEVANDCTLAHSRFHSRIRIELRSSTLDLIGTLFSKGGSIIARQSRMTLKQVSVGTSLLVAGLSENEDRPEVLSVQDADAGSMAFNNVDMSRCVFHGAHDLGRVVIEPTVTFAGTPARRFFSRRRCVADEFAWRLNAGGLRAWGWSLPGTRRAGAPLDPHASQQTVELPVLRAIEVASVYRDLRRSVELRADQPGAADFYYGEMEMRRHSTERGLPEQAVVWIYWALSGYGLRALRAFFALLLLVCAGTLALRYTGFESGCVTFQKAAISSLRSIVPGMRYQESLTPAGSVIEIVLRAVSPLLIALWILALRNRVKR